MPRVHTVAPAEARVVVVVGGGEATGLDDRLGEREVAAHTLGGALLEVHLRELRHRRVPEPGPVPLGVEPRDHLVGGERGGADDRFTGRVQRTDGTGPFQRGIGLGDALVDRGLLRLQRGEEAVELGLLLLEVGLLGAQRRLRVGERLAGLVELAALSWSRRDAGVTQLLAPGAVEHAAGEDVGGAGAVAARGVQRGRPLAQVVEQHVALLRELGALLCRARRCAADVRRCRPRRRPGAAWSPRASLRPRARPAARPRDRRAPAPPRDRIRSGSPARAPTGPPRVPPTRSRRAVLRG